MANSVKKARRQFIVDLIIIVVITVCIVSVCLILGSGKETTVTTNYNDGDTSALICVNHDDENSFYKTGYPATVTHEIKIVLKNDTLDKMFMTFSGQYENENIAEKASALISAAHNELLGSNHISVNTFSTNVIHNGNEIIFELFGDVKNINSVTSKLFYIDKSEFYKVKSLPGSSIKKLFENKGFSCSYQE